uniref:Signal peptide protein n=1 Tax=Heterorhabditis bacteriophora TaxID=37862 RepID=A0A1I7WBS7_HETBA
MFQHSCVVSLQNILAECNIWDGCTFRVSISYENQATCFSACHRVHLRDASRWSGNTANWPKVSFLEMAYLSRLYAELSGALSPYLGNIQGKKYEMVKWAWKAGSCLDRPDWPSISQFVYFMFCPEYLLIYLAFRLVFHLLIEDNGWESIFRSKSRSFRSSSSIFCSRSTLSHGWTNSVSVKNYKIYPEVGFLSTLFKQLFTMRVQNNCNIKKFVFGNLILFFVRDTCNMQISNCFQYIHLIIFLDKSVMQSKTHPKNASMRLTPYLLILHLLSYALSYFQKTIHILNYLILFYNEFAI